MFYRWPSRWLRGCGVTKRKLHSHHVRDLSSQAVKCLPSPAFCLATLARECDPWCFFSGCSCCSYPSVYHSSPDLPFSSSPQGTLLPFKDHSDTFLVIFGSLSFSLQLPWREELPTPLFCGPKVPSTEGKSISLMLVCGYFYKTPAHTQCNRHR